MSTGVEEVEESCPICGGDLDGKDICWTCHDERNDPAEAAASLERRKAYRDGRWIVDRYIRARCSEAEAIAKAEKPGNVRFRLKWFGFDGLVDILADRWATEALRQLLLAEDRETIQALLCCHVRKAKPGPRPKSGIHIEQEVLRLKRAGKTNGEIAKLLKTNKNTVAAAYNNITKKIAALQRWER